MENTEEKKQVKEVYGLYIIPYDSLYYYPSLLYMIFETKEEAQKALEIKRNGKEGNWYKYEIHTHYLLIEK